MTFRFPAVSCDVCENQWEVMTSGMSIREIQHSTLFRIWNRVVWGKHVVMADSGLFTYQGWCRLRGQHPVDMETEVVRTVIWTLRDKGESLHLNNRVEGLHLPHFHPHLDLRLHHLIPCSPLCRNCRCSNLNANIHLVNAVVGDESSVTNVSYII